MKSSRINWSVLSQRFRPVERRENQQDFIVESGKLLAGHKQQTNSEQQAASRRIHRQTHNASTQQGTGTP